MEGSATHFLNNFNTLCTLQKLDKHNNRSLKHKVAFFQLYLCGPARSWFDELDDDVKLTWEAVEEHFVNRFIIPNSENESDFYVEEQLFYSLTLAPGQKIEDFFNVILEWAELLNKSNRELMMKFISVCPPKLAYFVRATSPRKASEALSSARKVSQRG
jgi:hypothetical protein